MSNLSQHFPIITLSGFSAATFSTLFFTASEFQKTEPKATVQFHFNGQVIRVKDLSEKEAWDMYLNGKFERV